MLGQLQPAKNWFQQVKLTTLLYIDIEKEYTVAISFIFIVTFILRWLAIVLTSVICHLSSAIYSMTNSCTKVLGYDIVDILKVQPF